MATYVIGDIQGCFAEFQDLLRAIRFRADADQLCLLGDLVNRGPQSLAMLRWARAYADNLQIVLGNHDLHLLALAHGHGKGRHPTLEPVLQAPDHLALFDFLHQQPLLIHRPEFDGFLVHAGIFPLWDREQALAAAREVEAGLQGSQARELLLGMYGNQPDYWLPSLSGAHRQRFIINAFSRMRYIDRRGILDFGCKSPPGKQPEGLMPWYRFPDRPLGQSRILFGHWASLQGQSGDAQAINLDTGCVWGGQLTAYVLETGQRIAVPSRQPPDSGGD